MRRLLNRIIFCSVRPVQNRIGRAAVLAAAVLLLLAQEAMPANYSINPMRMEVHLSNPQRDTVVSSITVRNRSNEDLRLKVTPRYWRVDEKGRVVFSQAPPGFNLDENVKISPSEFTLSPGEVRYVRFALKLPSDTPADSEFRFQLVFNQAGTPPKTSFRTIRNKGKKQSFSIAFLPAYAATIYVTRGNPHPDVRVESFGCQYSPEQSRFLADVHLVNSGNRHARLKGMVIINKQDEAGNFLPVDTTRLISSNVFAVFPDSPRIFTQQVLSPTQEALHSVPGEYQLELRLMDERGIMPAVESTCRVQVPAGLPAKQAPAEPPASLPKEETPALPSTSSSGEL